MVIARRATQAVILAAGQRPGFDRPVALLELDGTTIIERQVEKLMAAGITKIVVVTGFKAPLFERSLDDTVITVVSDRYKWTGTMYSLSLVKDIIDSDFLLIEGDVVFEERALHHLLVHPERTCLLLANESGSGDEALVELQNGTIFRIAKDIHQLSRIDGEFTGLSKISLPTFNDMLSYFAQSENPYLNYEYALLSVRDKHVLAYTKVDDLVWAEIDRPDQYENLIYRIYPKLLKREREFHEQQIRDRLCSIVGSDCEIVAPIERLGGLNNINYKIQTNKGSFVLRLPGKGTETTVDREQEYKNAQLARSLGLDCETIYFDVKSGMKLTTYIDNAETLTAAAAKREANMELMARALRVLHSSNIVFGRKFDPFGNMDGYEREIMQTDPRLMFKDYDTAVRPTLVRLRQDLETLGIEYVACHMDPLPENFVKSKERIYLIDWEFGADYDRLWDVVAVCLECEFDADEEELFVRKYFGEQPTPSTRRKMDILRIVMDIHWALWALTKVAAGDTSLRQYANDRYERGKRNLVDYLSQYYPAFTLSGDSRTEM